MCDRIKIIYYVKEVCSAIIIGFPSPPQTLGRTSPAQLLLTQEQTSTRVPCKLGKLRLRLRNEYVLFLFLKLMCQTPLALLTSPPSRTSEKNRKKSKK